MLNCRHWRLGLVATPVTASQRVHVDGLITLAALGYLLLMFNSGSQPTHENLIRAVNDGVLRSAPESIVAIEISTAGGQRRYQRRGAQWHDALNGSQLDAVRTTVLERAITFMHTATPVRVLRPEEIAEVHSDPFGLAHSVLEISLSNAAGLVLLARFGNQENDGILRYMQLVGRAEIYMMSGFVGDAWQQVASFELSATHD